MLVRGSRLCEDKKQGPGLAPSNVGTYFSIATSASSCVGAARFLKTDSRNPGFVELDSKTVISRLNKHGQNLGQEHSKNNLLSLF